MERDRKYWYETYQEQKELSRGQINKLQEQVQELETLLHGSKLMTDEALETIEKLQKQNQRYKEAIDEICNGESNLEGLDAERELERVTSIAWDAKGESE